MAKLSSTALVLEDLFDESLSHQSLSWAAALKPGPEQLHFWCSTADTAQLARYTTADQTVWLARLTVINLVLTGTFSGHELFRRSTEPISKITAASFRVGDGTISPRVRDVLGYLSTSMEDDVVDLLAALHKHGKRPKPTEGTERWVPSKRQVERWVEQLLTLDVWAVMDQRLGKNARGGSDRKRRERTARYIDVVLDGLSSNDPMLSNNGIRLRASRAAMAAGHSTTDLLGRTQFLELISERLKVHGRTPADRKKSEYNRSRSNRASSRDIYPGRSYVLDATTSNVQVRGLTGQIFRPFIIAITEATTGVIVAIWATGRYTQMDVAMTLFEACQPFVLPAVAPVHETRVRAFPEELIPTHDMWGLMQKAFEGERLKPGGIPNRLRCDNATQQTSVQIMAVLRWMKTHLSTSRVARSTDNQLAEAGFGAGLNAVLEQLPGYVGRNTKERGRPWRAGDLLDMEELNEVLQSYAYYEHNYRPSTSGFFGGAKLAPARIDHYDALLEEVGEIPLLADRNALFAFLPSRSRGTVTSRGLRHDSLFYDANILHDGDVQLTGLDGHVTFWFDPRRSEQIWVHEPDRNVFHEIPWVFRDAMRSPLTPQILSAAKKKRNFRQFGLASSAQALAQIANQIFRDNDSVAVERDYSNWRRANLWMDDAIRSGFAHVEGPSRTDVVDSNDGVTVRREVFPEDYETPLELPVEDR